MGGVINRKIGKNIKPQQQIFSIIYRTKTIKTNIKLKITAKIDNGNMQK